MRAQWRVFVQQHLNKTHNSSVPLVLMNSFNTHTTTQKILRKYQTHQVQIETFNQSRHPRIYKETLLPMPDDINGNSDEWYVSNPPPPQQTKIDVVIMKTNGHSNKRNITQF